MNLKTAEQMYTVFLVENEIDHIDSTINQFLIEKFDKVCPTSRVIRYEEEMMKCSLYGKNSAVDEKEGSGQ